MRNDLAGSVYGGCYCDCFEPNLLFVEKNWTRLRYIPNFWFDLTTTEHRLIHIVDVLLVVIRLEKTGETVHTALMLSFQLSFGQCDINSEHSLLDMLVFVQFS